MGNTVEMAGGDINSLSANFDPQTSQSNWAIQNNALDHSINLTSQFTFVIILIFQFSFPDREDRQQRRRRFLSCSGLGAAEEASAFYDITNGAATTTTTTTNSSDNNNEEDSLDRGSKQQQQQLQQQQQQQTPFLLLDCGCCSGQMSMGTNRRFLLNEYPPDGSQV